MGSEEEREDGRGREESSQEEGRKEGEETVIMVIQPEHYITKHLLHNSRQRQHCAVFLILEERRQ